MKYGLLAIVVLAIFFSSVGTAFGYEDKALILVDEPGSPGSDPSSQQTLANLLGHFDLPYEIKAVETCARGDMDNYRVTFYLGSTWDKALPTDFLDDVLVTERQVVWINFNLWRLGWGDYQQAFEQKFGFSYIQALPTGNFNKVTFAGRTFTRSQDVFSQVKILDTGLARAVAYITNGTKKHPYIIQSGNFYFVADDPMAEVAEDSSYLVFSEVLHDMTGIQHAASHRALVRIEDIDPTEDPARIRAIADYLSSENVPFSLAVIPRFTDPLGAWGEPVTLDLDENPELVSALNYAVSRGGTIVMHGFTHQYGAVANPYNGVTGLDSEFYIQQLDASGNINDISPVPEDSVPWVQDRIDSGVDILNRAGFSRPRFWVTPHYLASELDYQVFSSNFGFLYQRFTNAYFPYVINRSVYGATVIPENLGYIAPGTITPQILLKRADRNLAIRDGFASFFFHSENNLDYLKTTVSGIKAKGYTFVDVRSLMVTDEQAPVITNIYPQGTVYSADATIEADLADAGSGIETTSVAVHLNGAPLACNLDAGHLSCKVSSLVDGIHTVSISVADLAGNSAVAEHSFNVYICTGLKPALGLEASEAYWGSYADYMAGMLTVDFIINNGSGMNASGIIVTVAGNTSGVTLLQAPGQFDLVEGGSAVFAFRYNVPPGVPSFQTLINFTARDDCGISYDYAAVNGNAGMEAGTT